MQKQISLPPKRPFPRPFTVRRQFGMSEIASNFTETVVGEVKSSFFIIIFFFKD